MSDADRIDADYRQGAAVTVANEEELRALLRRPFDFGCRPSIERAEGGTLRVEVIGTASQLDELRRAGYGIAVQPEPAERAEVGDGDRFAGGAVPHGFGTKGQQR
jgi:hypothetical protein